MKILKRKKVENFGQVALKCGRICSQLQRPTVKSVSASRPILAHETLRVWRRGEDKVKGVMRVSAKGGGGE